MAGALYSVTAGAAAPLALGDLQADLASLRPPWLPQPSLKLNWVEALRPRRLETIGVALEHDQGDAEILNRALGLVDRAVKAS